MIRQTEGWRDLRMALVGTAVGAGTPALANFGPTGGGAIKQMSFGVGDSVYVGGHVDHDYLPDSIAYPHVHFAVSGTNVNTVKWQLTYTLAKGHGQQAFSADTIITLEAAPNGTAWNHEIVEHGTGFSLLEPDALVIMEVKRITNGGTDNVDTVFGLFVDFHYQVHCYATPYRLPNFWTGV